MEWLFINEKDYKNVTERLNALEKRYIVNVHGMTETSVSINLLVSIEDKYLNEKIT